MRLKRSWELQTKSSQQPNLLEPQDSRLTILARRKRSREAPLMKKLALIAKNRMDQNRMDRKPKIRMRSNLGSLMK